MEEFIKIFTEKISNKNIDISILTNIILNDNLDFSKRNFDSLTENKDIKSSNEDYIDLLFFIFCLDLRKEFKNTIMKEITSIFKNKNSQEVYQRIIKFYSSINLNILKEKSYALKFKLTFLNNTSELIRKLVKKEEKNIEDDLKFKEKLLIDCIDIYEKNEIEILNRELNSEICGILIFYHNLMINLLNDLYKKGNKNNENGLLDEKVKNLVNLISDILMKDIIKYDISTKDLLFVNINVLFMICNIMNIEDFSERFINKYGENTDKYEILFIYLLSYYNNKNYELNEMINDLLNRKYNFLKNFMNNNIFKSKETLNISSLTTQQFILIYINNNEYELMKYSNFINNIIVLILNKLLSIQNEELEAKVKDYLIKLINSENIIEKLFNKIKLQRESFFYIDDNFINLLDYLYNKLNLKSEITNCLYKYLTEVISLKNKPLIQECKLFIFFREEYDKFKDIYNQFLSFLFSFMFDNKFLPLILEYTKQYFEFYKKNRQDFLNYFPMTFINYLYNIERKFLRNFGAVTLNLNKLNADFFFETLKYSYEKTLNNYEYYAIFFGLIRPLRAQKKMIYIEDNDLVISNKEKNIKISLELIHDIVISNDTFLSLELMEFINEFENKEKIFPIIIGSLKYSMKGVNGEFRAALLKSLKVYFGGFTNSISKAIGKIGKKKGKINENDKLEEKRLKNYFENIIDLIGFLSNNIYDRPIDILFSYLEFAKFFFDLMENNILNLKTEKDFINQFFIKYNNIVYEKGFFLSLISLLKHSWFFVRFLSFGILSLPKFSSLFKANSGRLLPEVSALAFSLRQMNVEGAALLFKLLMIHLGGEGVVDKIIGEEGKESKKKEEKGNNSNISYIRYIFSIIKNKKDSFINNLSTQIKSCDKLDFDSKKNSLHTYFVFVKNIIEIENENIIKSKCGLNEETANLWIELISYIISLLKSFSQLLINNGVSEFTLENNEKDTESTEGTYNIENNSDKSFVSSENKYMISLWNSSKYALEILNLLSDILFNQYPSICILFGEYFEEKFLSKILAEANEIVSIILGAKHMGVVKEMSKCLYKLVILLNKSNNIKYKINKDNNSVIDYSLICQTKIKNFITNELFTTEVSNSLRRSAGIPYLISTLIRSYITLGYSIEFINNLLEFVVSNLLNNFKKFATINKIDAAVHCIHILRSIADDNVINPYIRPFFVSILFHTIDGLTNENWSINNASMLMFSRLTSHYFSEQKLSESDKNLKTFYQFFSEKDEFNERSNDGIKSNDLNNNKNNELNSKIINVNDENNVKNQLFDAMMKILKDNVNKYDEEKNVSVCILLFTAFFGKLKKSRAVELCEKEVKEYRDIIFQLASQNSKIFHKILALNLFKIYGENLSELIKDILNKLEELNNLTINSEKNNIIISNQIDFYYIVIKEIFKSKEKIFSQEIKGKLVEKFKSLVLSDLENKDNLNKNYFILTRLVQLSTKLNKKETKLCDLGIDEGIIGYDSNTNQIDLNILFDNLIKNTRKFSYVKLVKHSLHFIFRNSEFNIKDNFNILNYLTNKRAEEILKFILDKKYLSKLNFNTIKLLLSEKNIHLIEEINVNLVNLIFKFILANGINYEKKEKTIIFNKFTSILNDKNMEKTELISGILSFAFSILDYSNISIINKYVSLISKYIHSSYCDSIRISACSSFRKIIEYIYEKGIKFNLKEIDLYTILKSMFLLLNDELEIIRFTTTKLIYKFNKIYDFFKIAKNTEYSSEFLKNGLLSKGDFSNENYIKFLVDVLLNNYYIRPNEIENKVFYFEPFNSYMDNIDNKIIVLEGILRNSNIEEVENVKKIIEGLKENKKRVNKNNIFIVNEEFCEKIKEICVGIIEKINKNNDRDKVNPNNIMSEIRLRLYK